MKILVAEDDALFRRLVEQVLAPEHDVVLAEDGGQAWDLLQRPNPPYLALLDWVMPVMSGPQICRKIREDRRISSMYLIILTAKNTVPDVTSGLRAGADDYVTKPFVPEELRARVRIGQRVVTAESAIPPLAAELQQAEARQTTLQSLLPICPKCRKVRSDTEYWSEVNRFIREYSPELMTESCPNCRTSMNLDSELLSHSRDVRT